MVDKITTVTVVMVVVMVITLNINGGAGSPVKPRQSPALAQASALLGDAGQHHRRSRSTKGLIDPSCKGYYDRGTLSELSRVCEDCDNLYREFGFLPKCRRDCFGSETFNTCLVDLEMDVKEYLAMAASLRGS